MKTGLDQLLSDNAWSQKIQGNLAYLCHSASLTENLELGIGPLIKKFGPRLIKIFGPQHGLVTDVQDNMVETNDYQHPYFHLPVHSLYGETRVPTPAMLEGIDTFIIDLQDVGTRVYTYITTMAYVLEACSESGISVVILDRPNPVGGEVVEGNVLDMKWRSFVGHHPIPMRHAMTMGEMAKFTCLAFDLKLDLTVIPMQGWKRSMFFKDTGLCWANPSPNLPTPEGAITFVGTVLFEGTNISEGRGTTRSLEVIGHPKIEPFSLSGPLNETIQKAGLEGIFLRPIVFRPMFQKYEEQSCGGIHVHITDPKKARPWRLGQLLLQFFKAHLGPYFKWNDRPYEYEHKNLAIDYINGDDSLREWVENAGSMAELESLEKKTHHEFLRLRAECLLYPHK